MLTPEQIKELKDQLRKQIQHLPQDQKEEAEQQIEEMSSESLEAMLEQQKSKGKQPQKGILRAIVDQEIPSKKIDENKHSLAVLDIKPISKGHIIIIPKIPAKDAKAIPTSAFSLAKKLAKRISSKLKSKGTEIQTESKFGESVINVIPVYDKPLDIYSPRQDASEKDLSEVYDKIKVIKKPKIQKIKIIKEKQSADIIKLPRRIP